MQNYCYQCNSEIDGIVYREDNNTAFALCCVFFIPSINNFLNTILQGGMGIRLVFVTPIAYIFMALISVCFLYRHFFKKKYFILIFMFFLTGVIVSYVMYPEIRDTIYSSPVDLVYSPINKLFFYCIPALIGIICINNYAILFGKIVRWSRITVILGASAFILVSFMSEATLQYMVYSYFMLMPICVCFEANKLKKSKVDYYIGIIGTITIIMCGARGAVMSLILYFFISIEYTVNKKVKLVSILRSTLTIILGMLIIVYYQDLLFMLADIFNMIGVESRVINYLISGAIFDGAGRESILDAVVTGLRNNPFGYGLYGDRYITGTFGYNSYTYAHNIFLELLCDFGVIFGTIAIIILLWQLVKTLFVLRNKIELNLIRAILPYALFQLFFSSSYLENIPFFALIGLILFQDWKKYYRKRYEFVNYNSSNNIN